MSDQVKSTNLRRMSAFAGTLLVVALILFIASHLMQPTFGVRMLRAGAEAALVGGLADWFAVVALFRQPLGLPIPHTAIIPKNKDRIADNLGEFVQDKFLSPDALAQLIADNHPAQRFAEWIGRTENAEMIGRHAVNAIDAWLDIVDDREIQEFFLEAQRAFVNNLDASKSAAAILETLTTDKRHQQLLDAAIELLKAKLSNEDVREKITQGIIAWAKTEHKVKQLLLPTETLSKMATEGLVTEIDKILTGISSSPTHDLRSAFDSTVEGLISRLKNDPKFRKRCDDFKKQLLESSDAKSYVLGLWHALRSKLSKDLESNSPVIRVQVEKLGRWLGGTLAKDQALLQALDKQLAKYVSAAAPGFAAFLTKHITQTIKRWDEKQMSEQIELSIGADLQYIRVNGTAVGAVIGIALFLISSLTGHL